MIRALGASILLHATVVATLAMPGGGKFDAGGSDGARPATLTATLQARPLRAERAAGSPGPAFGSASVPTYFPAEQLTKQPIPASIVDLNVPAAQAGGLSGMLALRLWIDKSGAVVDVIVDDSPLPQIFSRTAAEGFKRTRFHPGELNGIPVGAIIRIELTYGNSPLALRPRETNSE